MSWYKCLIGGIIITALLIPAGFVQGDLILDVVRQDPTSQTGSSSTNQPTLYEEWNSSMDYGWAEASLPRLSAFAHVTSLSSAPTSYSSSFQLTDTIFTANNPSTSQVTFDFEAQLDALLSGQLNTGGQFLYSNSRIDVRLGVMGYGEYIYTNDIGTDQAGSYSLTIDELVGGSFTIPVNTPVTVYANLGVTGATGLSFAGGFGRGDAADGLTFNGLEFFDFQTAGATANSDEFLVNNRLGNTIPEPGSTAILIPAAAILCCVRQRSRRKSA